MANKRGLTDMAKPPGEAPLGARFSHLYMDRSEPTQDSRRMRRRIGSQIWEFRRLTETLGPELARELGIDVPYHTHWPDLLESLALGDVLDSVTIAWRVLRAASLVQDASRWVRSVQRIFKEENVCYQIDDLGGVHFHPDEEFARNRAATVAALQSARYANALDAFEKGMAALSLAVPDGKAAIRGTFAACEGLFRVTFPDSPRLTSREANKLAPNLQAMFADDRAAQGVAMKLLASFREWVEAAHFYRHEPGTEEIAQPPLPLAIYLVSTGASHLRWLAEIDAANTGPTNTQPANS